MMARITMTVCDICEAAGEERPGDRHQITIDGKPYVIDLCDEHNGAVLAPLIETLAGAGRRAKSSNVKLPGKRHIRPLQSVPTGGQLVRCTEPGCVRTFDTEQRRNRHIGQGHKRNRANVPEVAFSA